MSHLRLVKAPPEPTVLAYTSRLGERYFLHEGRTKTGKPKYFFAKTVREGALERMPVGWEVSESINGVVSVRRLPKGEPRVPPEDVAFVESALAKREGLRWYRVRTDTSAIVVYEPYPTPEVVQASFQARTWRPRGYSRRSEEQYVEGKMRRAQYSPVMKFELEGKRYTLHRMTYRGHGGWSYGIESGTLQKVVRQLGKLGTEAFFELM